jgi:hypothetical protein
MCRVGRTLLSAAFDFGFDLELKIYVKGGGQECPPYTFLYNLWQAEELWSSPQDRSRPTAGGLSGSSSL